MTQKKAHEKYNNAQNTPHEDDLQDAFKDHVDTYNFGEGEDELPQIDLDGLNTEETPPARDPQEEAREAHLRALADMENYKKRLAREHDEQIAYAAEKVLASLLPSLDNLDLALQYGNFEACKDLVTGVEMTRKLLLDALKTHGLEPVGEVGEAFTPELHEALTFEQRDDMEENHVSTVMQKGYKLKNRLLRPAKVGISKK